MKCSRRILLLTVLAPVVANAEVVKEHFQYLPNISSKQFVLFEGERMRLVSPEAKESSDGIDLKFDAGALGEGTRGAGVLILGDGKVISASVKPLSDKDVKEVAALRAKDEVDVLSGRIAAAADHVAKLEADIEAANKSLREQAGLSEVDALYAKVAELEKRINELKEPN